MLNGASILITGGTGSLGNALIEYLLTSTEARRIVVFSRDELKQSQMRVKFQNSDRLRWFLGDIRDANRLRRAFNGIDYVIHAAALKQVDTGEYNPSEFISTNVLGSQNVIEAALDCNVKKVIALSTDKASSPINLYGATKLTADKLFIAANNYGGQGGTRFSVVRYGNVMGSRGSIVPLFRELGLNQQPIPITDLRMTRFLITLNQAVDFVITSLEIMQGGELYVPIIPSVRVLDIATALAPKSKVYEIGIRPGEKLHEEMISVDDGRRTLQLSDRYLVNPVIAEWQYLAPEAKNVPEGFSYSSDKNTNWLSVDELTDLFLRDIQQ